MRAKWPGKCACCAGAVEAGEEIAALLGDWVHSACKAAEIKHRVSQMKTVVVIETVPPERRPEAMNMRASRRRRNKSRRGGR